MEILYVVAGLFGVVLCLMLLGGLIYAGAAIAEFLLTIIIGVPLMIIMNTVQFVFGYSFYLIKCIVFHPVQTLCNPFRLMPWKYSQFKRAIEHQKYIDKVQSYAPNRPWEEAKEIYDLYQMSRPRSYDELHTRFADMEVRNRLTGKTGITFDR